LVAPTPSDIDCYTPAEQNSPTLSGDGPPTPSLIPEHIIEQDFLCSPATIDTELLDYSLDLVELRTPQPVFDIVSSLSNDIPPWHVNLPWFEFQVEFHDFLKAQGSMSFGPNKSTVFFL
jgi:hypothetical protein